MFQMAQFRRARVITLGAVLLLLPAAPAFARAASTDPQLDLAAMSGLVYDHGSAAYADAQTAVLRTVPLGLEIDQAKARLEAAGMRCWSHASRPDRMKCHAVLLESFEDRDPSSIIWDVAIKSNNGQISKVDVIVS